MERRSLGSRLKQHRRYPRIFQEHLCRSRWLLRIGRIRFCGRWSCQRRMYNACLSRIQHIHCHDRHSCLHLKSGRRLHSPRPRNILHISLRHRSIYAPRRNQLTVICRHSGRRLHTRHIHFCLCTFRFRRSRRRLRTQRIRCYGKPRRNHSVFHLCIRRTCLPPCHICPWYHHIANFPSSTNPILERRHIRHLYILDRADSHCRHRTPHLPH
mmetsp:Transcript_62206/g.151691  ORF Transcript_62206/g.151691 Transcript_62206/m.151691 type:complete len:212 (+) Transcript_62206:489-1124(+)